MPGPLPQPAVRFGSFEVNPLTGELRKQGIRIKLHEKPFQVLLALIEHPGEVVSRKELQERLWPQDTFVEFENSLNNAISRLREALGDTAETPRFIETLPRRGYRFLPEVSQALPASRAASSHPWLIVFAIVLKKFGCQRRVSANPQPQPSDPLSCRTAFPELGDGNGRRLLCRWHERRRDHRTC